MNPVLSNGTADIPCTEISPCATSSPPLRTAFGADTVTGPIFTSFYGSDAQQSITSCPALQTINPSVPATLNLDTTTLLQMDMRRIGTMVSAPGRLTTLRSQNAVLSQLCMQMSTTCPTDFPVTGQTVTIDVNGMRPRADLAAMTLTSKRAELLAHITSNVAGSIGEISQLAITSATYVALLSSQNVKF